MFKLNDLDDKAVRRAEQFDWLLRTTVSHSAIALIDLATGRRTITPEVMALLDQAVESLTLLRAAAQE